MKILYILLGLIVTAIILILIPIFQKSNEGFNNIGYTNAINPTRSDYIEIGKKRYNPMADTADILGPGIFGMGTTPEQRIELNNKVTDALATTNYLPSSSNKHTGMEPTLINAKVAVPPIGNTAEKIKKCESQKGRSKCSILTDSEFNDCGVCINAGSAVFSSNNAPHIGGMYITQKAKNRAAAYSGPNANRDEVLEYMKPSAGSCPSGFFYINKDECERAVRIQNCKEIKGGFLTGRTAEGLTATEANCAQCGSDTNTFVYQPHSEANSNPTIRVLAPTGTGITAVIVNKFVNNVPKQIGFGFSNPENGTEFTVDINEPVNEGEEVEIRVIQQFPARPAGLSEVFYIDLGQNALSLSLYNERQNAGLNPITETFQNKEDAEKIAKSIGCRLATFSELQDAYNNGLQNCNFGWVRDKINPWKASQANINTTNPICTAGKGLIEGASSTSAGAWCYGIKPQSERYQYSMPSENFSWDIVVAPFFTSYGADSTPSQANAPTKNSRHTVGGSDYVAPNFRAVILQWESRDFDITKTQQRVIYPMQPTISKINGYALTSNVMGSNLRQFGSFSSSQIITSPSASTLTTTPILRSSFWFWTNERVNNSMVLSAKVPGLLKKAIYPVDQARCLGSPLITNPNTLNAITVSACDINPTTQAPGSYTGACLTELFRNSGGSPAGELFPNTTQNINKLLKKTDGSNRTKDEIMNYLLERFTIATTGRNLEGVIQQDSVGTTPSEKTRNAINKAAKEMFGLEVITACETIFVNGQGQVSIAPKTGPFDQDCLTLLYNNAGYETSRAEENLNTSNVNPIKPTYTTISARANDIIRNSMNIAYSGLKSTDTASAEEKAKYPFRTCQPRGLMNPSHDNLNIRNQAILAANASGNTIRHIQDFYNTIYNEANTSYTADELEPDIMNKQKDAMQNCYGVDKFDETLLPTGCGQRVQYVRILRSVNGQFEYFVNKDYGVETWKRPLTNPLGNPNLNISQLIVLDPRGRNIALNKSASYNSIKPGTSASKPLDGSLDLRSGGNTYKDNGINNSSTTEYYMVNLGSPQDVRTVSIQFGTDDRHVKFFGVCIQLLDSNLNVVTQKVIDKSNINGFNPPIASLSFSRDDVLEEMPISSLHHNKEVFIQNLGWSTWIYNQPLARLGNWRVLDSVSGLSAKPGAWILKSGDLYMAFHRHETGLQYVNINELRSGSFNYNFYIRPALNGCRNAISIESADMPGRFLRLDFDQWSIGSFIQLSANSSDWEKCTVSLLRLKKPNSNVITT